MDYEIKNEIYRPNGDTTQKPSFQIITIKGCTSKDEALWNADMEARDNGYCVKENIYCKEVK